MADEKSFYVGEENLFIEGRDGTSGTAEPAVVDYSDIDAEVMQSMCAEVARGLKMRDSRHQPFTPEMEHFWKKCIVDMAKIPKGADLDLGRANKC